MEITRQFAKFVYGLSYEQLPEQVIAEAKRRVLDNLGAALAGCGSWPFREQFLQACARLGGGDCRVIGGSQALFPAARAAMINATYAQADELDDGHMYAGVHAGCVVVSTAMVIGSQLNSSGRDIITAVTAGYDIVYRLGVAMCPHLVLNGFHPSAVLDACGAVATAGKLLGLSEEKLAHGFGLAGLYGAGFMEATIAGQQSKCVMSGNGAFNGIMATYFAEAGLEGTLSVFEGKSGMFQAMSRDVDCEQVTRGLGTTFLIGDTYNKFYPTCRHAQAAIEACIDLQQQHQLNWQDIESVKVGTYQVAINLTGQIFEPQSPGQAKFSMPYSIALGLITGGVAPYYLKEEQYTKRLYLDLAAKVEISLSSELEQLYPERRGARVSVIMRDGSSYQGECFDLKGSPANPVGWEALAKKFIDFSQPYLSREKCQQLAERIAALEREADISSLYAELCS